MKVCEKCFTPLQDYEKGPSCDTCKFPFWFEQLSSELQAEVDSLIISDQKLKAVVLMKDALQIGLRDVTQLLDWRFSTLKESSRDKN